MKARTGALGVLLSMLAVLVPGPGAGATGGQRAAPAGRDARRAAEETVTVFGTRVPCIASVPFFLRDEEGRPLNEVAPEDLRATVDWYGEEVELPVLRVEPGQATVRLTVLVDTTPPFGDVYRTDALEMVERLLEGLSLDDEVRFVRVDYTLGLDDAGFCRVRDVYQEIGRWCARSGVEDGGDCPEIVTQADGEEAVHRFLRVVFPWGGRWDVEIREAYSAVLDSAEGFARHAFVAISDFAACCDSTPDPPRCAHPPGVYPRRSGDSPERPPVAVTWVVSGPQAPVPDGLPYDVRFLRPGVSEEIARSILERIPVMHLAVLDAGRICDRVRKCVRVELTVPGGERRVFSEHCTYVETPEDFARRVRRIGDPRERAGFVERAGTYAGTPSARWFAEGIRLALREERDERVRRVMGEVLALLEGP